MGIPNSRKGVYVMKRSFWRQSGRLWIEGLLLFLLRLWQNRSGFDPETGLAVPGAAGTLLVIGLALTVVVELALAVLMPVERRAYAGQFGPAERGLLPVVFGGVLMMFGGAVLTMQSLLARSLVAAAAGALGAAAGAGLLFLLRQARAGEELSAMPVLPAMFFGVFYVLAVYIPTESDPVLARAFLPVLAAAMAAYSFSRLGGFLRKEGSLGGYILTADLTVPLCMAAAADGGFAQRLLYLGCAVVLSTYLPVLLLLRRGNTAAADAAKEDGAGTDSAKADSANADAGKPDVAGEAGAPVEATRTLDPIDLASTRRVPERRPGRREESGSNQKRRK